MLGTTRFSISSLACLASLGSGCSVALMAPVPADAARGQARPHVDCTSSYAPPIVDSVLSAYELFGVGYAATQDDSDYDQSLITRKTDMALGAGFAALFVGSAVYGYVSATRCRRVKQGPPVDTYVPGVSSRASPPEKAGL